MLGDNTLSARLYGNKTILYTNKNDIEQATISKSSILNSDLIHYQVKNIIVSNSYIEHTNIVSSYLDDLTLDTNILIDSIFSNLHMNLIICKEIYMSC